MARGDDLLDRVVTLTREVEAMKALGVSRWGQQQLYRFGGASPTSGGGGVANVTFTTPFPTACDNLVFSFGNTSSGHVLGFKTGHTASGFTLVLTDSATGAAAVGISVEVDYWAWGH